MVFIAESITILSYFKIYFTIYVVVAMIFLGKIRIFKMRFMK